MANTIGSRLNALRKRAGMTLAEVASAAGMKGPSSVQSYFREEYDEPLRSTLASKFSSAMVGKGEPPIGLKELFDLSDIGELLAATPVDLGGEPASALDDWSDVYRAFRAKYTKTVPLSEILKIPVYPSFLTDDVEAVDLNGNPMQVETFWLLSDEVDSVAHPPAVIPDRCLYMLYVSGNSMAPRFRYGEPLFVDPRRPPAIGEDVIVRMIKDEDTAEGLRPVEGPTLVATLIGRSSKYVELEQYNPPRKFRLDGSLGLGVYRVLPWKECFGM